MSTASATEGDTLRETRSGRFDVAKVVAGAVIRPGTCGEDDVTAANLRQMADTLATRPPTDDERRELVEMLRWLAKLVDRIDNPPTAEPPTTDVPAARDHDA